MGKAATVRYKPNPEHNSLIKLRVTKVQRGKIKQLKEFRLSAKTKRSSVYYVKATVTNTGSGDLSGQVVSLYGKVSKDLVVPPVNFRGGFKRCQHQPLPKKFTKGKSADLCVVMLAPKHGKVTAVQWRPANDAEPISWPAR